MVKTREENGGTIVEVDLLAEDEPKTEKQFIGRIKGIAIPLSFKLLDPRQSKRQEIHCYFSAQRTDTDCSDEIRKTFRLLYKRGKYAPHTHLIPMGSCERPRMEDPILMGIDFSKLRYSISSGELPATATIRETMEFFPCYEDVLPVMIKHYGNPSFFLTLMPETAFLNIKHSHARYMRIPLRHVHVNYPAVGHPCIQIMRNAVSSVHLFKEIEWQKLIFEEDAEETLEPWGLGNVSPYLVFK